MIKHLEEEVLKACDGEIQTRIWFKSPVCLFSINWNSQSLLMQPLEQDTIRLINGVKLFAESHDQDWCGDDEQGNWTWFEIAILENEDATAPRMVGNEELVKLSHMNSFRSSDYTWQGGQVFTMDDEFLSSLEVSKRLRSC